MEKDVMLNGNKRWRSRNIGSAGRLSASWYFWTVVGTEFGAHVPVASCSGSSGTGTSIHTQLGAASMKRQGEFITISILLMVILSLPCRPAMS